MFRENPSETVMHSNTNTRNLGSGVSGPSRPARGMHEQPMTLSHSTHKYYVTFTMSQQSMDTPNWCWRPQPRNYSRDVTARACPSN